MVDMLYRLGQVAARITGARRDETAALRASVARRPGDPDGLWKLGLRLFDAGLGAEAEPFLRRLVALQPGHGEGLLRLARIAEADGRAEEAAALTARVLELRPEHAKAAFLAGRLLAARGEPAAALPFFERATAAEADFAEAVFRIAQCHEALAAPARALDVYGRALALKPDYAEAACAAGLIRRGLGDATGAETDLRRALACKPDFAEAMVALAELRLEAGDFAETATHAERALAVNPAYAEALLALAGARAAAGDHAAAATQAERALALKPDYAEAALRAAESRAATGGHDQALALCRRALALKPDYAEALLATACNLIVAGDPAAALEAAGRALALKPDYAEALLTVADLRTAAGETAEAAALAARALALKPECAEAALMVAEGHALAGETGPALDAARRAVALNPRFAEACSAVDLLDVFPPRTAAEAGRPPARRPLVCVPVTAFLRSWLGGQIYVRNFARILSLLPRARRPRLVVVNLLDDWRDSPSLRETMAALSASPAVIGVFDRTRRPLTLAPGLGRRLGCGEDRPAGDPARIAALFARIDYTFPLLYPLWSARTLPRPLFWIPDFQQNRYPGFFGRAELLARHRAISALSRQPAAVLFSSRDALADYRRLYPGGNSRDHVWSFASIPDPPPPPAEAAKADADFRALGLPERFYYTPNQFWRHKDHGTLFRALRLLIDRGLDVAFVCTGNDLATTTDPYALEMRALIDGLELGGRARLLGVLSRPLQMELMRRAGAILQPSLFEGWSTVVEDARTLGRPLILSDIAVHREQAAGYARFFRAGDADDLARAVADFDPGLVPGPDPAGEAVALADLERRARACAGRFLDILTAEAGAPPPRPPTDRESRR